LAPFFGGGEIRRKMESRRASKKASFFIALQKSDGENVENIFFGFFLFFSFFFCRNLLIWCPRKTNCLMNRVARWYVFKPKIQIWVNFGGPWNEKSWYSMAVWNILLPFWYIYGHSVM
jgi:hypothetical protein